jgi:hypothetical protein
MADQGESRGEACCPELWASYALLAASALVVAGWLSRLPW